MSRFPLFPLLLSLSTTLQSACLQDKCTLPEFENNAECKVDNTDMGNQVGNIGPIRSYVFNRNGEKIIVDSIGMIDVNKIVNGIVYTAEVALLVKYQESNMGKSELVTGSLPRACGDSCVLNAKTLLKGEGDVNLPDQMSVTNLGVRFVMGNMFYFYNWDSFVPSSNSKTGSSYYSLSSDVDDRIHAIIDRNTMYPTLSISKLSLFTGSNLNREPDANGLINNKIPKIALVGNFRFKSLWNPPEVIVWDNLGVPIGTLSTYINVEEYHLDRDAAGKVIDYNASIPVLCKMSGKNCEMFHVANGDLDGNGLSDLIVAESDVEKKSLTIAAYYNNIGVFFRRNLFEIDNTPPTPVQAIAVSIPSGDDPPKLVWATSSFIQDSGNSTGTNTITINVLPIMN